MASSDYPLNLLYDGACPLCKLEMDNLASRDGLRRLVFTDISAPDFDPAPYAPATREDMGRLIHAVRPDGSLVVGVEVFRLAYGAVGLGAWWAPTAWGPLAPLFDRAYAVLARNRMPISVALRPLLERLAATRAARQTAACANGACTPTIHQRRSPL